ncbi:carboxylesterase/lipase family protein [Prauserella cavernicola]|uniref:Carboxylic ester hydrolase n=1 Tax=Prauserella cavernicola TaxID=2800127 RepID=A0A934QQ76_9PSEU|nr:carboxylesterase family protein [Prauserella cavernicola]MBK1783404.1 carboxylesterase/lipase family protein [Prauserella cavernicola]
MSRQPVVRLGRDTVTGVHQDGVAVFRGIPYAAAPVGPDRFTAPRPATWSGPFDATRFGPTAPQARPRVPGAPDVSAFIGPGWIRGDDYLNLNVWTPDPAAGGLPVLVFVHGGAFVNGAGLTAGNDGTRFARGGVVVVTINYRLGVPGFLRLPGAPDNRGLLDQVAALRWVAEHIAAFGGDPGTVTVSGQSAGAMSVAALLAAAPPGLFRRAISESGGASHALTPEQADLVTSAVAANLGVPATPAALAKVDADAIAETPLRLAAVPPDLAATGVRDPQLGLTKFAPVVDGELLTGQPLEAIAAGSAAGVEVLAGTNADEMNLYRIAMPAPPVSEESLRTTVAGLHPDPDALIESYRRHGRGSTPVEVLSAIGTDYLFAVPTARFTDAHAAARGRTWRYEFTWRSPAHDGRLGACHGSELPFVFGTLGRANFDLLGLEHPGEAEHALSEATHAAWVSFIRDGDPGWPRHTPDEPAVQRIGPEWTVTTHADGPERELWKGVR